MRNGCFGLIISIYLVLGVSSPSFPVTSSPAGGRWANIGSKDALVASKATDIRKEVTVEAWVYLNRLPGKGEGMIILEQPGSYILYIVSDPSMKKPKVVFVCKPEGAFAFDDLPFENGGRWHHVAAVWERGRRFQVFVDGKGSKGGIVSFPSPLLARSGKPLRIGGVSPGSLPMPGSERLSPLDGYLDEIRVSDISRYEKTGYRPPRGRFKLDSHTVVLWHCDEGPDALQYKDSSGNGNDLIRKR